MAAARIAPKTLSPAERIGEPTAERERSPHLITTTSYVFSSSNGVALENMSSGTTQLVASNSDDGASPVMDLGFDFWYDGVRLTQFSCNANGLCRMGSVAITGEWDNASPTVGFNTTTNAPKIAAYFDDLWVGTNGQVHSKVIGSAPNRKLVVEWQNMQIPRVATGQTGAGTFQMWLSETSGVIEFVYGSGVATNSVEGGYSIGLQSGAATNFASVTSATDTVSYVTANNTQTGAIASGKAYIFTPQTATAPSGLAFTGTTAIATTLNWTDNSSNELGFAVYRSTDNVNFTFVTQTAAGATSFADSGLSPSTQYFYRVYAVTEGALGTAASNNVTTNAAGNIVSTGAGGDWSATATWVGGIVPTDSDNVTIVDGATVTIDTAALAYTLTVGAGGSAATLQFEATTARTLTVGTGVTIATNGVFQSAASGTQTGHVLTVGANLTNDGVLDFSTNANMAGAGITFVGATDNDFSGLGATTDVRALTVNKGTDSTPILTLKPSNFTVQGVTTDSAGFLTLTNGTFKLSGTFTVTNRVFTAAAYTIGATTGFWLNNPNFTVAGQNGSPTTNGLLKISQGTFAVGTAIDNSMGFGTGSEIVIEGGDVNATGRFGVAAASTAISYDQSGGTITVCTIGTTSTTLACFDLGTSAGSTIQINGGTVVHQLPSSAATGPRDYRNQGGVTGTTSVNGGTVQFGNAASGAAKAFSAAGVFPNIDVDNTSAGHSVTLLAPTNFNNISRDITIETGTTLNVGNNVFLNNGQTLTNNGTLTANGASTNFVWFLTTAPMTYTGTGTVTAPMTNFAMQADMGVTIDPSVSNIVVGALRIFSGSITNANKITIGNGGATTGIVQIGNTTTPTNAGSLDVAPTFNLGTGGQTLSYLRTTTARTTGFEVNPTRVLTSLAYDDSDPTHTLTISGGDLTMSSTGVAMTLNIGRIVTNANALILSSGTATVTRTLGYVDGNLRKNYAAAVSKNFEVGTANGYSPVTANVTAGTFPSQLQVKATQGTQPIMTPASSLQRYWTLTETGDLTANLTFNYLDGDVNGTEASYVIFKILGGSPSQPGGSVNTGANTATINGVSSFSDWTLAEPSSPTRVLVRSFAATRSRSGVALSWRSASEAGVAGYELYRGSLRLNRTLVAARGGMQANAYRFVDRLAPRGTAQYRLRVVLLDGRRIWAGSARVGRG